MTSYIGVDIGGTQIRVARFDESLALKGEPLRELTPSTQDSLLATLFALIRAALSSQEDAVAAIGVGLPGPLDLKTGTLISPPNLPFEGEVPIRAWLEAEFGPRVAIGNDADLAGLAEHQLGAGRGAMNMIYITVSTGVGGGIIIGGKPYSGQGLGGEIGHIVVNPDGPLCGCGRRGHLEAYASGTAIANRAKERMGAGEPSLIAEMAGGPTGRIDARLAAEAARRGDALAVELFQQAGRYLGVAIASLAMLLNPDRFVLGGAMMKSRDLFQPEMEKTLADYVMTPRYLAGMSIETAQLGDNTGLIGAGALARMAHADAGRSAA